MMSEKRKLQNIGWTSVAVVIPQYMLKYLNWDAGQYVEVSLEDDHLIVKLAEKNN